MNDVPCSYPVALGLNITTGINNTPKLLGVFRNESSINSLTAILQIIQAIAHSPNIDTVVAIQFLALPSATGGVWSSITGSELEVNKTATVTGGKVASTLYCSVSEAHGSSSELTTLADLNAKDLGLELKKGQKFAIYATTGESGATCSVAWAVNWIEKD